MSSSFLRLSSSLRVSSIFVVIFIFEAIFIFEVVFIFEVIFIFQLLMENGGFGDPGPPVLRERRKEQGSVTNKYLSMGSNALVILKWKLPAQVKEAGKLCLLILTNIK